MFFTLLRLYLLLLGVSLVGAIANRYMPPKAQRAIGPEPLGRFMFWVGIPLGLIGFMRQAEIPPLDLTLPIVVGTALMVAWGAASVLLRSLPQVNRWTKERRGSFKLAAMMGNTGYLGYPVCLAVAGNGVFGWVLLYDLVATVLGNYGLGVWLASRHGRKSHLSWQQLCLQVFCTPALWGFAMGAALKSVPLPLWGDRLLAGFAWGVVGLSLMLIGMRLSQLRGWHHLTTVAPAIAIKLLLLPVVVALLVPWFDLSPNIELALILQAGMPCAFSTLILAEEYALDREATVTAIAGSSFALLLTLPLWISLWGQEAMAGAGF